MDLENAKAQDTDLGGLEESEDNETHAEMVAEKGDHYVAEQEAKYPVHSSGYHR